MTKRLGTFALGVLATLVLADPSAAQNGIGPEAAERTTARPDRVGRIVGRVVDADTGRPLSGAQVVVVGTRIGTLTNVDGRYALGGVPEGLHSLRVVFIGHGEKTVEGVNVIGGQAVLQDLALTASAIEVEGITVSATRETSSITAALDAQRTAVAVTSATTAQQISRSPDGDAAQAIQRVSGVTVQGGKFVFVRGLGERYTTTSLNGARLPSAEPEKRVVALDLFPANLLEAITTSKSFTPDQPGDFSGAQVDLRTRSFPSRRMFQLSLTGGLNGRATGRDIPTLPATGREWLGMAASDRRLPTELVSARTDFTKLTQTDVNRLIRSFPRNWTFQQAAGQPNLSAGVSFGGEDPLLGRQVGYVGSLSYARSQEIRSGEVRARAVPEDAAGTPAPYNAFAGTTGQTSVLLGGMLNLSTRLGRSTKLELNNTYDRSADSEAHVDWGTLEEFQQVDSVRRTSLRYVERVVRSNQLRAEHRLGGASRVAWSLTSSGISRSEPDRADLAYGYEFAPTGERLPLAWLGFIPEAAKRTSSDITEEILSGNLDYTLELGSATLRAGGAHRHVQRDARTTSFNVRAIALDAAQRVGEPRDLFYGPYTSDSAASITLEPNSAGGSYFATDDVTAAYVMAEVQMGSRVRVTGGARTEWWTLDLGVEPIVGGLIGVKRANTDLLPSLAVSLKLTASQTIRLSATRTLARPEYRELAPISYRDMLGEREIFGDSSLVRTRVHNYDARWEWYPSYDEALSIGVFAKKFDDPIEPIDVATSGASQLSFINAASATNYGIELEVRKGLGFVSDRLRPTVVFANATLMRSRINTGNSTLSALTNDDRPMVGQAPYVVNAGISYEGAENAFAATLLYNVVGKRITSAAVMPLTADTYDHPRHVLDLSVRFPMYGGMTGKLDAKNLLDSPHEELQGDVVRHRYRTGRTLSLGVSWSLR